MLVPLIPLWVLLAAGLDQLPSAAHRFGFVLPILITLLTIWQGQERRSDMMNERLHADPVIRYAHLVSDAVDNFRATGGPTNAETLMMPGIMAKESMHLSPERSLKKGEVLVHFLILERALKNVDNLRLFFPDLKSVSLVRDLDEIPDNKWLEREIYFNSGMVGFSYLGKGILGRYLFACRMFQNKEYQRARKEIEKLLQIHPGYPQFISELGMIGMVTDNQALVDSVLTDLGRRAETGPYKDMALQEYNLFKTKLGEK